MSYHPGIKQIVYTPAEEISALRHPHPLATLPATTIKTGGAAVTIKAAEAADIVLTFAMCVSI